MMSEVLYDLQSRTQSILKISLLTYRNVIKEKIIIPEEME